MALSKERRNKLIVQIDGIIAVLSMQVTTGYGPGEREAKELLKDARLLLLGDKPEDLKKHDI